MKLSRMDVFEKWRCSGIDLANNKRETQLKAVLDLVLSKLKEENDFSSLTRAVKSTMYKFVDNLNSKWEKSGRSFSKFMKQQQTWLKGPDLDFSGPNNPLSKEGKKRGRPKKEYDAAAPRSKRRKMASLRDSFKTEELCEATVSKLRSENKVAQSRLLQEATLTTPTRASKIVSAWDKGSEPSAVSLSPDEALAHLIRNKLTKQQYQDTRLDQIAKHCHFLPPYDAVRAAKKQCYPRQEDTVVTAEGAEVKLQALLDITSQRLVELIEPVLQTLPKQSLKKMILVTKWGSDGASGQSEYKQKGPSNEFRDSNLYVLSLVPLQLYVRDNTLPGQKLVVWENHVPSSTAYCRPIKFMFTKESAEVTKSEILKVKNQIFSLNPSQIEIPNLDPVSIIHSLALTMVDGKVAAALAECGAQTCLLCGCTPKNMNAIDDVLQRPIVEENLQYGLSSLHAWIRSMEYILHLSYRLGFKKWQATGANKQLLEVKKREVQVAFKSQLGLAIDQVKPGGAGNSNDGNTARRFFENPGTTSSITGIDEDIITRFSVILKALSSGLQINPTAYNFYALETAKKCVEFYSWYYMPASTHKMLIHGAAIIVEAELPIGKMSEDAQEARNKEFREFREHFSRKISREATNQDLLNRLLVTSDPIVTSLRKIKRRVKKDLGSQVLTLLLPVISSVDYVDKRGHFTGYVAYVRSDTILYFLFSERALQVLCIFQLK